MKESQRNSGWRKRVFSSIRFATASALVAGGILVTAKVGDADAAAGDRALTLHNAHTNESATIVFKRNGRYDAAGLKKLNYFLRDWRKNQPTNMDPKLFDLIWSVYQQSGSRVPIQVVCGFRSPETNGMLRSRSRGVAKHSQHMLGKAMDFYIPDVPLTKLREIGFKMQVGGVGFYPTSGSPFVHMDTGSVRSWPRMSRQQLVRLFPDGKTMHIPDDGKPLPGYAAALAAYKSRKAGGNDDIVMASASAGGNGGKSFLARLFGGGADEEEDNADVPAPAVKVAKATKAPAPAADDSDAPAAATAKAPQASPDIEAAPAETVVAMAPLPRRSPMPQQQDDAADAPAVAAAEEAETVVAMAPVPRPSPVANEAAEEAPVVVADASAPVPRSSPAAHPAVANPMVALASASSTGGTSVPPVAAQLAAFDAVAAPHQPATAAEAIADAVGKGGSMGPAPVLAYAAADEGAPRIDASTGALVAGRAASTSPSVTGAPIESADDWQDPLARFTALGYSADTIELVTRQGSTRQKGYAELEMPRPFGDPALFTSPERAVRLGFGRIAYEGLRTDRFSGPLFQPVVTVTFASADIGSTKLALKR
jgi:uncharacterized protein YcbK (DUF882 family)